MRRRAMRIQGMKSFVFIRASTISIVYVLASVIPPLLAFSIVTVNCAREKENKNERMKTECKRVREREKERKREKERARPNDMSREKKKVIIPRIHTCDPSERRPVFLNDSLLSLSLSRKLYIHRNVDI